MPDTAPSPLEQVADAYNTIHASIQTALATASDGATIASLMTDDKAAYNAYKNAMGSALQPDDPVMRGMLEKLKAASDDIDATEQSLQKIEVLAARIDKAVGVLAKIAALAA